MNGFHFAVPFCFVLCGKILKSSLAVAHSRSLSTYATLFVDGLATFYKYQLIVQYGYFLIIIFPSSVRNVSCKERQ